MFAKRTAVFGGFPRAAKTEGVAGPGSTPGRRSPASAEHFANRRAGDFAGGLAGREEAAVERDARGEAGVAEEMRDLGVVGLVEEVL